MPARPQLLDQLGPKSPHVSESADSPGHLSINTKSATVYLTVDRVILGEWMLHPAAFQQIQTCYGTIKVDLFASDINCQVERFFTGFHCLMVEATDALAALWPPGLLYVFPPVPVTPQLLQKI